MRRKRAETVRRVMVPVLSICLLTVIGFGAWKTGVFRKPSTDPAPVEAGVPVPKPDGTIQREKMPETIPTRPILRPGDEGYIAPIPTPAPDIVGGADEAERTETPAPESAAVTGDGGQKDGGSQVTGGVAELWWRNRLVMTGELYWAIEENPGAEFSVLAVCRPAAADIGSFVYEGKTLAEWAIAADNERILPDKMSELLKLGDELKYGEALCETGTPDGIKWDRSLYEDRVVWFGDLLDRYIADGEFLRAELEADISAYHETSAREDYRLAYQAWLEAVLPAAAERLSEIGISCERAPDRTDALILLVTAEQLEELPPEYRTGWHFSLDSDGSKGAAEPASDAAGPRTVN